MPACPRHCCTLLLDLQLSQSPKSGRAAQQCPCVGICNCSTLTPALPLPVRSYILDTLLRHGLVTDAVAASVKQFIADNQTDKPGAIPAQAAAAPQPKRCVAARCSWPCSCMHGGVGGRGLRGCKPCRAALAAYMVHLCMALDKAVGAAPFGVQWLQLKRPLPE